MTKYSGKKYTPIENVLMLSVFTCLFTCLILLWKHQLLTCVLVFFLMMTLGRWAYEEGLKPPKIWNQRVKFLFLALLLGCSAIYRSGMAASKPNSDRLDTVVTKPLQTDQRDSNGEIKANNDTSTKQSGYTFSTQVALPKKISKEDVEFQKEMEREESLLRHADEVKTTKLNFEKNCLSSYDGSCTMLEIVVKNSMNDPDSYEHIETTYRIEGKHAIVYMRFRGKNAYGAKVVNAVKAKVDFNCNVLYVDNL